METRTVRTNGRGLTPRGEGVRWRSLAALMERAKLDNDGLGDLVGVGGRTVEMWLYAEFAPGTNRLASVARALAKKLGRQFPKVFAELSEDLPESRRRQRAVAVSSGVEVN